MTLVSDAVAEVSRDANESELKAMARILRCRAVTDEVVAMLPGSN